MLSWRRSSSQTARHSVLFPLLALWSPRSSWRRRKTLCVPINRALSEAQLTSQQVDLPFTIFEPIHGAGGLSGVVFFHIHPRALPRMTTLSSATSGHDNVMGKLIFPQLNPQDGFQNRKVYLFGFFANQHNFAICDWATQLATAKSRDA